MPNRHKGLPLLLSHMSPFFLSLFLWFLARSGIDPAEKGPIPGPPILKLPAQVLIMLYADHRAKCPREQWNGPTSSQHPTTNVWKTFQLPSFPEAASRSCKALFSFLDKRSLGLRYVQSLAQMVAKWPLLVEAKGRQSLEVEAEVSSGLCVRHFGG